jgi:hypothetical protein
MLNSLSRVIPIVRDDNGEWVDISQVEDSAQETS